VRLNSEEDTLREADRTIYFATSNKEKYAEAALLATEFGIRLKHLNVAKQEIQADNLEDIALFAASHAANSNGVRVVSEDAGFFVNALHGFPGPYSAYVFRQIGTSGVLKLMRGIDDRKASFEAAVAHCAPREHPRCFTGVVRGTVTYHARGRHGFGFDPIFMPLAGGGRTFAEMTTKEKNLFSHRAKAFTKFCRWFNSIR
jgi:XTP/dITP diphosphohydrolase